ncbi:MAG: DUF4055 domain-containing protein [Aridibacter sp.]
MEQKDLVNAKHPDYDVLYNKRKIYKDVFAGTLRLRKAEQTYLRKFPAELPASYADRLNSSTLFNMTEKTANIMTGLVFQNEIELQPDVPGVIKALTENIDNQGNHLNVFARECFLRSFEGLSLILVDAPDSANIESLEDERRLELRPYWIRYDADDIINWKTRVNPISKSTEISLIVLRETKQEKNGMFLTKDVTRYRVLYLDDNNDVAWQVWREDKANINSKEVTLTKESFGIIEKVSRIPIAVIYGQKTGILKGDPPLLDLAMTNLRHYNKQSNYDNLLSLACIPVLYAKGMEAKKDNVIAFGSDILVHLSADGELGWALVDGGAFASLQTDLKDIENQMALLGLSLLADKTTGVDLTATEALLNSIAETAELRVMASSLSDALETCLDYTAEYLGLGRANGGGIKLGTAWSKIEMEVDTGDNILPQNPPTPQELTN